MVRAVNLRDGQLTLRVLSGLLFSGHLRLREQSLGLKGTAAKRGVGEGRETNGRQRTSLSRKKKERAQGGDVFPLASCLVVCGPDQ